MSDEELLLSIGRGDADALGSLYDRYGRVVFGLVLRMLPSAEAAEEVTQDVFHAVWRRGASYRAARGSVRTWLLAIARNAAIDWRRTRGKRTERELPLADATAQRDPVAVEEIVERSLRGARVGRALAALPAEQREVVVLSFYLGLSQSEIATRTGQPLGTVKGRARLAMARLRRALREEAGA